MKESEIKLAVIRWLLSQDLEQFALAAELNFADGVNRADLVLSSRDSLTAFEIKSSFDDFRRFERQELAYRLAFLQLYVVVPSAMLPLARTQTRRSTGLLVVTGEGRIHRKRAARPRAMLTRENSTLWFHTREKKRLATLRPPGLSGYSEAELSKLALETVHTRLMPRYQAFLRERGENINSDDLMMLSSPSRIN